MIVAVWVLASLLVGALLAAFVLYGQTRNAALSEPFDKS